MRKLGHLPIQKGWTSRSLGGWPQIDADLRALVRRSAENSLWGAGGNVTHPLSGIPGPSLRSCLRLPHRPSGCTLDLRGAMVTVQE
jgi:hypothetical protein